jgi:hypothetical protein
MFTTISSPLHFSALHEACGGIGRSPLPFAQSYLSGVAPVVILQRSAAFPRSSTLLFKVLNTGGVVPIANAALETIGRDLFVGVLPFTKEFVPC